jgi:multidrug resistance efflux pump
LPVTVVVVLLAVGGLLAVAKAWGLPPFSSNIQTTDNAYVRGTTTVISPQVSGYVTAVLVRDFDNVKAGQVLVQVDDRIYRQRVEQAKAQLEAQVATLSNSAQSARARAAGVQAQAAAIANARAQLVRAQADMRRVEDLVSDGSVSQRERDQTFAALGQAEAAVRQAEAARDIAQQDVRTVAVGRGVLEAGVEGAQASLRLAEIDLSNTAVRAPGAGRLSEIGVRQGQYVTAGTQLMFLVPAQVWVIANFREAQTARMAPGQPSSFTVDALANVRFTGRVEQMSPAAGSEFAVLKPDNATGNFTKVPQRIAVRITIGPNQPLAARLRPGMSVQARVDTRGGPRPR